MIFAYFLIKRTELLIYYMKNIQLLCVTFLSCNVKLTNGLSTFISVLYSNQFFRLPKVSDLEKSFQFFHIP